MGYLRREQRADWVGPHDAPPPAGHRAQTDAAASWGFLTAGSPDAASLPG